VVAASGGLPEMVKDGVSGLVFDPGNAEALAERTLALCDAPELAARLGRKARESAVAECSPDAIYTHTMELYRYALGRAIERGHAQECITS
jgi:glycosyltransferase involved in cell wall biosynthesis